MNNATGLQGCVFFHLSDYISLSHISIRNCRGYGLHMDDVCGKITITRSLFNGSNAGNAVFWMKQCRYETIATKLQISHSNFTNGRSATTFSTGLYVLMFRQLLIVNLKNLVLKSNTGNIGIKFIDFSRNTSNVTIKHSTISDGNATTSGGGLNMWFERMYKYDDSNCTKGPFNRTILK